MKFDGEKDVQIRHLVKALEEIAEADITANNAASVAFAMRRKAIVALSAYRGEGK